MMQKENNVGSVALVDALVAGEASVNKLQGVPKSRSGSSSGLLKVIRLDNWQTRADIVRGSFTA